MAKVQVLRHRQRLNQGYERDAGPQCGLGCRARRLTFD